MMNPNDPEAVREVHISKDQCDWFTNGIRCPLRIGHPHAAHVECSKLKPSPTTARCESFLQFSRPQCVLEKGHSGVHSAEPVEAVRTPANCCEECKWTCGYGHASTCSQSQPLPSTRTAEDPKCPNCGYALEKVTYPSGSMLNRDQFDATRAGDWYCGCHNNNRGNRPYAYFWDREVAASQPSRTPAVTQPVMQELPPRPKVQGGDYRPHYRQREMDAFISAQNTLIASLRAEIAELKGKK